MKYDEQYYILGEGSVASLDYNTEKSIPLRAKFSQRNPIDFDGTLYAKVYCYGNDPKKEKFNIGNYFNDPRPTMIHPLREILEKLNLFKIQFFPIVIEHLEDKYEGFHLMHCYNFISALHRERSKYDMGEGLCFIDSLSLDENVLDQIPEEERLVFCLGERTTMYIVHEKFVNAVRESEIDGMYFTKVKDWGIGDAFD